jgi:ABC-type multidrug transport system fused ATPase/permease subunit
MRKTISATSSLSLVCEQRARRAVCESSPWPCTSNVLSSLAGGSFLAIFSRLGSFSLIGERLTERLRIRLFRQLVRQPIAFYDNPQNSVGRITTKLSSDASLVKGAVGESLGSALEAVAAIITAIVIALFASWRLGLVSSILFQSTDAFAVTRCPVLTRAGHSLHFPLSSSWIDV